MNLIDLSEKTPAVFPCLLYNRKNNRWAIGRAHYSTKPNGAQWYYADFDIFRPTHWFPLPYISSEIIHGNKKY